MTSGMPRLTVTWQEDGRWCRRCKRCGRKKDLTRDFYKANAKAKSIAGRYQYYCKRCSIRSSIEWTKRARRDPKKQGALRAKNSAEMRRWRRENPVRYREALARYRQRIKEDPERHERFLADRRIEYRLRQERKGRTPRTRTTHLEAERPGYLPTEPLLAWLDEVVLSGVPEDGVEVALEELGLSPRSVRGWRSGERSAVHHDIADRALTLAGAPYLLYELYPELAT